MCINREEKANEFFQNVFTDFVGDFKYLIMLAMLDGAAYIAFERKASKAIPLILVLAVAVWLVGDTSDVFNWILDRMRSWGDKMSDIRNWTKIWYIERVFYKLWDRVALPRPVTQTFAIWFGISFLGIFRIFPFVMEHTITRQIFVRGYLLFNDTKTISKFVFSYFFSYFSSHSYFLAC